jgi:hypothetical protein
MRVCRETIWIWLKWKFAIYRFWQFETFRLALVLLSLPTIPAPVQQDLEARILVGESVGGPDILRAHGPQNMGRPRRRADRPVMRVAA